MMIHRVDFTPRAMKNLRRAPSHIIDKLDSWVDAVERLGIEQVRKIPGYHDEPLKGARYGQRSIRLSRSYRAIYRIVKEQIQFVLVEEVNKHEY
jgi:proteic killer suppression protein